MHPDAIFCHMTGNSAIRVGVLDDDQFSRSLITSMLEGAGFEVSSAATAQEALALLDSFDPHAMMLDLDLGTHLTGLDVMNAIKDRAPWVAIVILSSHRSPQLIGGKNAVIPRDVVQLVKNDVLGAEVIAEAINAALSGQRYMLAPQGDVVTVTSDQADVLRMIALGYSNQQIADARGTGIRAAEAMVKRTLDALGVADSVGENGRVAAIKLYRGSGVETS